VPGDVGVRSLKTLLDRLDAAAVEVDGLTVHTPDLDDVFFAVTGGVSGSAEVTAR
jgi:ABC-2 type transport system ATP-binding protein